MKTLAEPLTLQECETKYHSVLSLEYTGGANTEENTRVLREYLLHCERNIIEQFN